MAHTGKMLAEFAEERGLSINRFAKEVNGDKGFVSSIFKGDKPLTEKILQATLVKKLLLPEQAERLREAFYREVYGEEAYARLLCIQRGLKRLAEAETVPPPAIPKQYMDYTPQNGLEIITNRAALCAAVCFILQNELQQSEKPQIITNYPFAAAEIDDIAYHFLRKHQDKAVDFRHYVMFECAAKMTLNMDNIFGTLRYFRLRHNLHGYPAEKEPFIPINVVYPHYFVTSGHVLLFHAEQHHGLLLADVELAQTLAFQVAQQHPQYFPLAQFPKDEMELKQVFTQKIQFSSASGELSFWPCLGPYCDKAMYCEVFHQDIPARAALIDSVDQLYHDALRSDPNAPLYHTVQGFKQFAQTGRFQELSQRFVRPAPSAIRAELLRRVAVAVKNGTNLRLLDEKFVPLPQGLAIELFGTFGFVTGSISPDDAGFMGEFIKIVDRPATVQDFADFLDYIDRNAFYYPADWTVNFLEKLAAEIDP